MPFAQKNGGYGRTAAPFACGDETFLPPSRTELFGGAKRFAAPATPRTGAQSPREGHPPDTRERAGVNAAGARAKSSWLERSPRPGVASSAAASAESRGPSLPLGFEARRTRWIAATASEREEERGRGRTPAAIVPEETAAKTVFAAGRATGGGGPAYSSPEKSGPTSRNPPAGPDSLLGAKIEQSVQRLRAQAAEQRGQLAAARARNKAAEARLVGEAMAAVAPPRPRSLMSSKDMSASVERLSQPLRRRRGA